MVIGLSRTKSNSVCNHTIYQGLSNTNKTMPSLKEFTNELLCELMSSLEQDQQEVRIKAFALAKRTFAKTRYSSHIQFLGKCWRKKFISSGFRVNFHPGFDTTSGLPLHQVKAFIFSCSFRLMKFTVSSMKRTNDNLTVQMSNCRNALKTVPDAQVYGRIVHNQVIDWIDSYMNGCV